MIVVTFRGGLGNQMFQYAMGVATSLEYKIPVLFDLTHLKADSKGAYTQRDYELDVFNVKINFAEEQLLKKFKKNKLERVLGIRSDYIVISDSRPQLNLINNNNVYLDGFWQNEKYFINHKQIILDSFCPKNPLDDEHFGLITKMKFENSLSVHIRRGDYVTNAGANAYHGLCTVEYYNKAIQFIRNTTKVEHIYIFSDDIDWCKKELTFDLPTTFIENNKSKKAYIDILLMSSCKHNIIANSSFSWWGAWLNTNTDKIVVGPEKWATVLNDNTKNILPKTWIRI